MSLDVLILAFVCAGLLCALVALTGVVALLSRIPAVRDALDEWVGEPRGWEQ